MAEKIKASDIFSGDLTGKAIKEFEALIKVLERLEEQQKDNLKVSADGLKINAKEYDDVKKNIKLIQDQEKAEQTLLKTKQQREKLEQERIKTINQGLTQKQKELALSEKKRKIAESSARSELKLNGAYDKQSKRLNQLRKQYKNLVVAQNGETKATIKMRNEIQKLDTQLKKVDASAGQFQRSVGNYGKAFSGLKSLGSAVLPVAGVTGLVTVMGNAVKVFRDFEKANSNLRAVTGATDGEMDMLSNTAKRLGASTAFTASEVTGLQTEFAKLGFTTNEIQNATAATLDLAAASGTELADAAAIAGSTLGGFQLGAEETQRVVDVMAKSFSTSALDMEKFKESMKDAAPAAAAVGLSVEETTALLGTLSNAGISGSKAGTALKSSLINLNKAGLTLNQAFEKVSNSTDKLGTATELVGKNAAASFLVLAEGTETTKELTKGLLSAEGAAKKMSEVQLDNLAGDVTKLGSAWEGFILGVESGNGSINKFLRGATQLASKILGLITPSGELAESWFKQRDAVNELEENVKPLLDRYDELNEKTKLTDEEQKELDRTINQISEDLPGAITQFDKYGKAMDISTDAARRLLKQQKDLLALDNAEAIEEQEDEISGLLDKLNRLNGLYKASDEGLLKYNRELDKATNGVKKYSLATFDEINNYQTKKGLIQGEIDLRNAKIAKLRGEKTELEKLNEQEEKNNGVKTETKKEDEAQITRLGELKKKLKELKKEQEGLVTEDGILDNEAFVKVGNSISETEIAIIQLEDTLNGIRKKKARTDATGFKTKKEEGAIIGDEIVPTEEEVKEIIDYQTILTDIIDRETQKRIELIDKEIEANEKRQSVLQELAGKGIQDAKENLAEEKKQQAELERERERALKRQQRIELGLAVLNSYTNNVENDVNNPLAKTITDTSVLLSFIQSLPTFYDGTENTGQGGKVDNKGGFHAVLHPNERVMTAEQNRQVEGLSNWELSNLGKQYKQGNLNPILSVDNSEVVNKLDQLVNKPTYLGKDYDSTEKAIIDVIAKKGRIERNHKKTGKNLF